MSGKVFWLLLVPALPVLFFVLDGCSGTADFVEGVVVDHHHYEGHSETSFDAEGNIYTSSSPESWTVWVDTGTEDVEVSTTHRRWRTLSEGQRVILRNTLGRWTGFRYTTRLAR